MCTVRKVWQGVQIRNSVSLAFLKFIVDQLFSEAFECSADHAQSPFFSSKSLRPGLCEALPFLHFVQCTDVFRRFRNQRTSPETPSYHSQACTPPINIKKEPFTQPSPPSDSPSLSTEDRTLLKRRNCSPQVSQIKKPRILDTKYYGHKKARSSLSGPLAPKAECKLIPSKSRSEEASPLDGETMHKGVGSKIAFNSIAPLLSGKAELKLVDELKIRRARLLRATEQKCEDDCQAGMKPCSFMLRLEIMHGGYAKSWVK